MIGDATEEVFDKVESDIRKFVKSVVRRNASEK
jgi:hypothetical protein